MTGVAQAAQAAAQQATGAEPFDPGDYTVSQVMAHVHAHPEEREAILAAELEGRARSTLIERLHD